MSEKMPLKRGLLSRLGGRVVAPLIALTGTERGSSLVELAFLLPLLSFLLLGVIDFGRAYYLSIEVTNAAYAGAEYGTQYPSDTTGMTTAANNDAHDISAGVSPVATYGCECSDLSGTASASCATQPTCTGGATVVSYVKVTTSYTYNTMFHWPGIPSSFALTGSAKMRATQ